MEKFENEKDKSPKKIGDLLFIGSMFLGMAAGWYFDKLLIGMFAGMGIGFILRAVVIANYRNK